MSEVVSGSLAVGFLPFASECVKTFPHNSQEQQATNWVTLFHPPLHGEIPAVDVVVHPSRLIIIQAHEDLDVLPFDTVLPKSCTQLRVVHGVEGLFKIDQGHP